MKEIMDEYNPQTDEDKAHLIEGALEFADGLHDDPSSFMRFDPPCPASLVDERARDMSRALHAISLLARGITLMADKIVQLIDGPPATARCFWCWRAAGDTAEAWAALPAMLIAEVNAHVTSCAHNPYVASESRVLAAGGPAASKIERVVAEAAVVTLEPLVAIQRAENVEIAATGELVQDLANQIARRASSAIISTLADTIRDLPEETLEGTRSVMRRLTATRISQDESWARFGPWCSAERRSAWIRFVGGPNADPLTQLQELQRVEIRAGREGDDFAMVIDRSNPQFAQLNELFSTMLFAAET